MESNFQGSSITRIWWNIWRHLGMILYNTHHDCEAMKTENIYLALWSMSFVFSISLWRIRTMFAWKISNNSKYGSKSIYWNQSGLGICEQKSHIVHVRLCAHGLAHISTYFDGQQGIIPLCTENSICWTFECIGVTLWQINQLNSTVLRNFLVLCHRYQQHYSPTP